MTPSAEILKGFLSSIDKANVLDHRQYYQWDIEVWGNYFELWELLACLRNIAACAERNAVILIKIGAIDTLSKILTLWYEGDVTRLNKKFHQLEKIYAAECCQLLALYEQGKQAIKSNSELMKGSLLKVLTLSFLM